MDPLKDHKLVQCWWALREGKLSPDTILETAKQPSQMGVLYQMFISTDPVLRPLLPVRVFLKANPVDDRIAVASTAISGEPDPLLGHLVTLARANGYLVRNDLFRDDFRVLNPYSPNPLDTSSPFKRKGLGTIVDEALIDYALLSGADRNRTGHVWPAADAQGFHQGLEARWNRRKNILDEYLGK